MDSGLANMIHEISINNNPENITNAYLAIEPESKDAK